MFVVITLVGNENVTQNVLTMQVKTVDLCLNF